MSVFDGAKFSMAEIGRAFGVKPYFEGGISYGVLKLDIPIKVGDQEKIIQFRQGDDLEDHFVGVAVDKKQN